jgi:hypothetical protein
MISDYDYSLFSYNAHTSVNTELFGFLRERCELMVQDALEGSELAPLKSQMHELDKIVLTALVQRVKNARRYKNSNIYFSINIIKTKTE